MPQFSPTAPNSLSAVPIYNPQPASSFVVNPSNIFSNIGQIQGIAANQNQNALQQINVAKQRQAFQDEQDINNFIKKAGAEIATTDNPADLSPQAKLLQGLSTSTGLPTPKNYDQLLQAIQISSSKQAAQSEAGLKAAQATYYTGRGAQAQANAANPRYGAQAQTLQTLTKLGIPLTSVIDQDAKNIDVQNGMYSGNDLDYIDQNKYNSSVQQAQQAQQNKGQSQIKTLGVDPATGQPIVASFNRATGQVSPLANLPVMVAPNAKTPLQQVQALLPPGANLSDYATGQDANGNPIYNQQAIQNDIQAWQAKLAIAKGAGNPSNILNSQFGGNPSQLPQSSPGVNPIAPTQQPNTTLTPSALFGQ